MRCYQSSKSALLFLTFFFCLGFVVNAQQNIKVKKKDRKKDVEMVTTKGVIIIRLSDSTPLHRDNFIRLVKSHFYDSIIFHRVIQNFMIQAGDPTTKRMTPETKAGEGDPGYTVPAEFRLGLYHKKGVIAAARTSDDVNPLKASSGSQFYLVQGKVFTDAGLDSVETYRLKGKKIPETQRQVYKTVGGTPHLDQNYTVFGEIISGYEVVETIAAVPTSGPSTNYKPIDDVRIVTIKLVKRKK
ncbi:peptidylprolyl isomerase [Pollutibacter soli]|uniref:peptidylprolyl isomerase n=1 Tax=Pollutibacter soli TaxID=3034157 RepID=UPI003013C610